MKTIGIIANCGKPRAAEVLARLGRKADEVGMALVGDPQAHALLDTCRDIPLDELRAQSDAVIAIGGDGTMLRAVRAIGARNLPIIGLNIGGLGFLTSVAENEIERMVDCLSTEDYTVKEVSLAEATILRNGQELARYHGLNEVVVTSAPSSRVVTLDVAIDDDPLTSYVCDGVIVATPCGSTGHSLSAGGPILSPVTPAFVITVICPHTLSSRPLIVPDQSRIDIRVARSATPELTVSVDGQVGQSARPGDVIRVSRAAHSARLIHLPGYSYFAVLRQKLRWSGSNLGR